MARINNKELTEKDLVDYKQMVLFVDCGVGTRSAEAYLVHIRMPEKELEDYAWERALEHGQSYGVYPDYEQPEDFDPEEEGGWLSEEYNTDAIGGWFVEYDAEKHDGQLLFGSSRDFQWNYC